MVVVVETLPPLKLRVALLEERLSTVPVPVRVAMATERPLRSSLPGVARLKFPVLRPVVVP